VVKAPHRTGLGFPIAHSERGDEYPEAPVHARPQDHIAHSNIVAMLRSRGVTYLDVLAGLGDLGLRPPHATMEGPNVEARERGRRRLRELLARPRP
jgi:hypothetical protein